MSFLASDKGIARPSALPNCGRVIMPLHRALLKTHHMTSRVKIRAIKNSTGQLDCKAVIKTGRPPGVMLVESENGEDVGRWVGVVKRLRYKDYRLLRMEAVDDQRGRLPVAAGSVLEFTSMKELGEYLKECGIHEWWIENMGFGKGGGV